MINDKHRKINVLHLFYNFYLGGAEKLLLDILKNPSTKEDIDYSFAVITGDIDKKIAEELPSINKKNYIFPLNLHKKRFKTLSRLLKIIRKNHIDIIHCHEESGEKWAMLCKFIKPRLKVISTVHDTNIINELDKRRILLKKLFVDSHIAISKSVLEECRQNSISKSILIHNGIEISKYHLPNTKKTRQTEDFKIINVARIDFPKKGQDVLIKAISECKKRGLNIKCDIVGGRYSSTKNSLEYLKSLVKLNNLENEISFLGHRTNIPELLNEADLFVLSSRYEGFGLVVLEAMAANLPVIASNIDGPGELIKHGENGLLFENENYIDLADKIQQIYNDRETAHHIAKSGLNFAKNFDISIMCIKYAKLYKHQIQD